MKYKRFKDGKERARMIFDLWFTREELADANRKAKALGYDSARQYLAPSLDHDVEMLHEEYAELAEGNPGYGR